MRGDLLALWTSELAAAERRLRIAESERLYGLVLRDSNGKLIASCLNEESLAAAARLLAL